MNYAVSGDPGRPALLLVPGQTESWWGYEKALPLLAGHFQAYAVDLRGQGRSSWTPGRYTLDNLGNDLVRFIDLVIGRPTLVSGLSSGGVLAAWLSAYAKPGQVRGAVYGDPPLFSSETRPACGRRSARAWARCSRSGASGLATSGRSATGRARWGHDREVPPVLLSGLAAMAGSPPPPSGAEPPQNLKEYDPEWARAFVTCTVTAGCDHAAMLASVRVPVLFTHHYRRIDPATGHLLGAIADHQADCVRQLVEAAGQPFTYRSFPEMPHSMHGSDPDLYARAVAEWASALPEPCHR